jgi:DNA-binding MarR family transcriptional regulator
MTSSSQSPRDRVLWILANKGGKITRSSLRRDAEIKLADLDIILAYLEKEGRIKRTVGEHGELISLK